MLFGNPSTWHSIVTSVLKGAPTNWFGTCITGWTANIWKTTMNKIKLKRWKVKSIFLCSARCIWKKGEHTSHTSCTSRLTTLGYSSNSSLEILFGKKLSVAFGFDPFMVFSCFYDVFCAPALCNTGVMLVIL